MRRAQQLWNAIQDARRREEEGQGSSSSLVPLSRGGITPQGLVGRGMGLCLGRAGGEDSHQIHHPTQVHHIQEEEAGIELCLLHLPNPSRISLLHTKGDSRIIPIPYCGAYSPMVGSSVPPDILSMTPMPLPIMMICLFPPGYTTFCCIVIRTPSLCITPHIPSFLTLHLPIPL